MRTTGKATSSPGVGEASLASGSTGQPPDAASRGRCGPGPAPVLLSPCPKSGFNLSFGLSQSWTLSSGPTGRGGWVWDPTTQPRGGGLGHLGPQDPSTGENTCWVKNPGRPGIGPERWRRVRMPWGRDAWVLAEEGGGSWSRGTGGFCTFALAVPLVRQCCVVQCVCLGGGPWC